MKPVIGITPSLRADDRFGELFTMGASYVNAVTAAGGVALILPPQPEAVDALAALLDGVIFSGGGDIRPDRFGDATVHEKTYGISDLRDEFELALLQAVLRRDLPVLAICRGIQVLNVGLGGTLYQDVSAQYPGASAHTPPLEGATRHTPTHTVAATPGSLLAEVYEEQQIATNSFHHQSLKALGEGLEVVGCTPDGSIEAVVLPGRRFVLGLQWHPEMMFAHHGEHLKPFERLVREAAVTRAERQLSGALAD